MPDGISVSVTLTKHDIWQYYFAANKKKLIGFLVLYVIVLISVLYLLLSGSGETDYQSVLVYPLILFVIAVIIAVLCFLTPFFGYRRLVAECRDGKTLDRPTIYHINSTGIVLQSERGQVLINWRDIYKLAETRPQMIVYQSVAKVCIIPKRCFAGAGELQAFVDLAVAVVDRKRLKIKFYRFGGYQPETAAFTPPVFQAEPVQPAVTVAEQPLVSISVILSKREMLNFNMYHYYSQPAGIILTLLGIALLGFVVWLSSAGVGTFIPLPVLGFLGVYLLIGAPILIMVHASRMYKTDATIRDTAITYQLYGNRIAVETSKGNDTRYFGDFRRLKQYKGAYLFYLTRRLVYLIPKRFITDPAGFESYFMYMQSENTRLKSIQQ